MNPLRILVVVEAGETPLASLGPALREAGHEVRVASPEVAAELLAPGGQVFDAILRTPVAEAAGAEIGRASCRERVLTGV